MRAEIHGMQRRLGITTIFVTHDQLEAMTLSDQVAVMRDGRIEQIGTPREVYERPASKYVMDFIGNVNHVPAKMSVAGGVLRARVAGGDLALRFVEGWSEGDDAVLAFRSEAVSLGRAGARRGRAGPRARGPAARGAKRGGAPGDGRASLPCRGGGGARGRPRPVPRVGHHPANRPRPRVLPGAQPGVFLPAEPAASAS